MTHGFRIALQSEQMFVYRAAELAGFENHPGRYVLLHSNIREKDKIQAELENIGLIWYGWYRLYREVLGSLVEVQRFEEALLLAEASLKVRIDTRQKDQNADYKRDMQSVVLAIALTTEKYDRAYPILKEWILKDKSLGFKDNKPDGENTKN